MIDGDMLYGRGRLDRYGLHIKASEMLSLMMLWSATIVFEVGRAVGHLLLKKYLYSDIFVRLKSFLCSERHVFVSLCCSDDPLVTSGSPVVGCGATPTLRD